MIVDVKACPVPAQDLHVDSIEIISCFQDKLLVFVSLLGRAWASPTLIMTMAPLRGIMVSIHVSFYVCMYVSIYLSIYLCLYHLPRVCRTLVPEIRVCTEMLHVFQYIDVLTCVIYNCMHWTAGATRVCREDYRWRQVGECAQTHGINGYSLLRQWSSGCLETCQCACVCESKTTNWAYCTAILRHSYRQRRNTTELTTVRPECYL